MTLAACASGKDVYVEKPLTHDLAEGAALLDASTKYKRIVQVGTQQRSMPHIVKAGELIPARLLGAIEIGQLLDQQARLHTISESLS